MKSGRMLILAAVLTLALPFGPSSVPAYAAAGRPAAMTMEAGASAPAARVVSITIDKATFGDTPAGIKVGDTVEWINNDIFDHTSTSAIGGWDIVVPAGKKARVVMKKAGVFDYICKYHPNMIGTVVVKK